MLESRCHKIVIERAKPMYKSESHSFCIHCECDSILLSIGFYF